MSNERRFLMDGAASSGSHLCCLTCLLTSVTIAWLLMFWHCMNKPAYFCSLPTIVFTSLKSTFILLFTSLKSTIITVDNSSLHIILFGWCHQTLVFYNNLSYLHLCIWHKLSKATYIAFIAFYMHFISSWHALPGNQTHLFAVQLIPALQGQIYAWEDNYNDMK